MANGTVRGMLKRSDDYGWLKDRNACWIWPTDYALKYPAGTDMSALPVYVTRERIKEELIKGMYELWERGRGASGGGGPGAS